MSDTDGLVVDGGIGGGAVEWGFVGGLMRATCYVPTVLEARDDWADESAL